MKVIIPPPELIGHPDILAMLQGFYSRSHLSIEARIRELSEGITDPDKIRDSLKRYYVNYNHESIGDCGDIPVFIEGVSMLTTVALQTHPLYNGQESSTRYIDFGAQARPAYADEFYDRWLDLYKRALPLLIERFATSNPEYSEAGAKAAAFDVARGLLPIGVQTQLSFKGSIRVLREQTARLMQHPLKVVRDDAPAILQALYYRFPGLFADEAQTKIKTEYDWFLTEAEYTLAEKVQDDASWIAARSDYSPTALKMLGTRTGVFGLDYASFRDLQRHRNAHIRILPLLGSEGARNIPAFHPWYVQNLPEEIRQTAFVLRDAMREWANADLSRIDTLVTSLPMMSMVDGSITLDIPQLQYMSKLRTARTVHPTLRSMMAVMVHEVVSDYPSLEGFFTVHEGPNDYAKRGTQTILKDGEAIQ